VPKGNDWVLIAIYLPDMNGSHNRGRITDYFITACAGDLTPQLVSGSYAIAGLFKPTR
jgi:hypothetical protein